MTRASHWRAELAVLAVILLLFVPESVRAQRSDLLARCVANGGAAGARACADLAAIIDVVAARTTLVAAGGNPVPGTASTLGHRIPGQPRFAISARWGFVPVDIPSPRDPGGEENTEFTATAWSVDAVLGLFAGFSPAPTVGGVASVDLFAGVGAVQLASAEGFRSHSPGTWTAGVRVGILRESFTLPGISLAAAFRRTGRWNAGDVRLAESEAFVVADDAQSWVLRATVGKRLGRIGLTAGAGFDRTTTDAVLRLPGAAEPVETRFDSYHSDRVNVFGNAAWTWVIATLTAELGWQNGMDDPADGHPGGGGLWAGLGARVTF